MIKLEGIVLNVFTQQGGKDKKTGDQFTDRDKVQILGAMDLPNGDVKNELFTLSVENYRDFSDFLNQKISIPVGAMASGRNVIFYVAKGAQPELAKTVWNTKKNSELGLPTRCFFFFKNFLPTFFNFFKKKKKPLVGKPYSTVFFGISHSFC